MTAGWALWLLLVPLAPLALLLAYALPSCRPRLAALAPWAALPALAAPLAPDLHLPLPGLMIDSGLMLDATGRTFLAFTALLWWLAGLHARGYLAADKRRERFFGFWLAALAGNLGLILAADALTFYAFFTLMGFAAYGLVVYDGSAAARRAGRVYLLFVVAGEILLFAGLVSRVTGAGGADFAALASAPPTALAAWLLLAAFATKVGALPVHSWLALAHPAAPAPASAVLSGAMIKAGLFGWLRFLPPEVSHGPALGTVVMAAGLAAAFLGVAAGLAQRNPKTLLAYSSISQMGLITAVFGAGLLAPGQWGLLAPVVALYVFHHALAKGALFMGVPIVRREGLRGLALAGMLLPAIALAGLPLTSGAAAKAAFKLNADALPGDWPEWLAVLLPLASFATALLMVRLFVLLAREKGAGRAPQAMRLPWLALVLLGPLTVWGWPEDALTALAPGFLWGALWPPAAALALAAFALRAGLHPPRIPEGDLWPFLEALWIKIIMRFRRRRLSALPWIAERMKTLANRAGAFLERAEATLRSGQVAGLLFLVLLLAIGVLSRP